ncbi:hypothetical protein SESBI_25433 [Sesbania bispinosa]|nr:hypothetical protein SESBI_25433 [Sesbania bispinosa]
MNSRVPYVPAAAQVIASSNRFRSATRPLPKRGQIKSKIAATAFHSIVSAFHLHSPRKN